MESGATRLGRSDPDQAERGAGASPRPRPRRLKSAGWPKLLELSALAARTARRVSDRLRGSASARALRHLDQREATNALYHRVFDESPVGIALIDERLRIVDANPELSGMLGRPLNELRGSPLAVLATSTYPARLGLMARKAATGSGKVPVVVEHRYRRADGSEGWARTSIRRFESGDQRVAMVCIVEDYTSDQLALEEQRREAERDPLTGLLNRRGGDRRLRSALERMAQSGPVAVILCDADRFKVINDRFGHAAGDELLAGMAGRLRAAIRSGDEVARIGGDEFIVVARVASESEAAASAERCVLTASGPFRLRISGAERVTLSAGVAVAYPGGPVEPSQVLAAADRALYAAKAAGGGCWKLATAD